MKITIKIIQLLLILCWYQQAIGQINKPSSKQKAEKFDIQKLYQFKAQNKTEDTLPDGSRVGYIENSKEIQETIKAPDSGYNIVKQYYKDNLLLEREERFFYNAPIAIMKQYNHSGKLIRELNYESIFKYSIKDVAKFIFTTYKIDIFKDKNFGILRQGLYTQTPYYDIDIFFEYPRLHTIFLNGITGQIISEADGFITR